MLTLPSLVCVLTPHAAQGICNVVGLPAGKRKFQGLAYATALLSIMTKKSSCVGLGQDIGIHYWNNSFI